MCSESESDATLEDTRAHVIHARIHVPNSACTYHNHEYEGDSEKKELEFLFEQNEKKIYIFLKFLVWYLLARKFCILQI